MKLSNVVAGIVLVSSVPMHNVHKMLRNRTMSMEDYDKPMKERINSLTMSTSSEKDFDTGSPVETAMPSPFDKCSTEVPIVVFK